MNLLLNEEADLQKLIFDAEYLVERRNPKALPLAKRAMQLAMRSANPQYFIYAKYILAFYYSLVKNDYDKSIEICQEVLEAMGAEGNEISYKLYMTLGNSYQLKGEIFSAQECYMKGLKQLESRKKLNSRETGFLASLYYNLSLLLSSSELNISSEEYLQKAIEIYKEVENGFKLSKCYVAYAGVLEGKGQYRPAIEMLFKALEIDERMNDPYSIALSNANLGIQHLHIGECEKSLVYLQDALAYYSANNMLYETAMVRLSLGETYFAIHRRDESITELREAEELFNRLENKRELSKVYRHLSNFLSEMGDYKSALEYQRKYTESLKYFFDIEKTNALARAQKEFQTEQREKETALLKEKNEEIRVYVHKLEISNNELNQFAHVASHDMREPLRMISSYMTLLNKSLKGTLNEQQTEFVHFALDGAKRLEQLIVDMLRLAKVDANPRIEPVRLQSVVDEISLNLDALVKEKNAVIAATDLPEIMADRTQMLQLFQNIIGNGIKYNESGRPSIKLRFVKRRDEMEISVADNGIGIPEHLRELAFQIFQRLHTERQYSGSGIGLAICKKIIESMNGKISIEENPTGGSIFRISLPNSVCISTI